MRTTRIVSGSKTMKRTATILALAAALAFGGAAKADDVVILDSTVASIGIGDVLSDATAVSIPSGESVTLILSSGDTKILAGPYSGPIGAAENVESAGLDDITASRGGDTKVLGAVRAPKWEVTN